MTFESEGLLIVAIYIWLPPVSYVVFLTTLIKNFKLGDSFLTRRCRAFIFHMYIPSDKTFPWVPNQRGKAFIFHMYIHWDKTFPGVPWFFT